MKERLPHDRFEHGHRSRSHNPNLSSFGHSRRRCKLQSFTHLDFCSLLQTTTTVPVACSIHRSFSTPCLSSLDSNAGDASPHIELIACHDVPRIRVLIVEAAISVVSGLHPTPVMDGLGGAYFLRSHGGEGIAIVKPIDEEPLAINNPKEFAGMMLGQPGLKQSVRVGETGIREVAAYLLDHGGFAGVPPTALIRISHPALNVNNNSLLSVPNKIASLQRFVNNSSDAGDLGPSCFSVSSVHRIGILDIRILNLDRHSGNMLVQKRDNESMYGLGSVDLVPIDHGLCLPEWFDDPYFEWLHWPQGEIPFSDVELAYISSLDPFKDAEYLKSSVSSLPESSIRVLIVCTIFLQRATTAGLCLSDIGRMMTRGLGGAGGGEGRLSILEDICIKAKNNKDIISWNYTESETSGGESMQTFQLDEDDETQENSFPIPMNLSFSRNDVQDKQLLSPLNEDDDCDTRKTLLLSRSLSFVVPNSSSTCDGVGIRLGDMSTSEFQCFLNFFEEVLPEYFKDTMHMGLKNRLGSSCTF